MRRAHSGDEKGRKRLEDKHEGGGKLGLDLERKRGGKEMKEWKWRPSSITACLCFERCGSKERCGTKMRGEKVV